MGEIEVSTIARGREIGKGNRSTYFIWDRCIDCGKVRWVASVRGIPVSIRCPPCNWHRLGKYHLKETKDKISEALKLRAQKGPLNPFWKGGRQRTNGYIFIWLTDDSPYASMRHGTGYIAEHRLIMAQHLGRCLLKSEQVHHIDGIRDHNELSNLELVSRANHNMVTAFCDNCKLRKEIQLLRCEIEKLTQQFKGN